MSADTTPTDTPNKKRNTQPWKARALKAEADSAVWHERLQTAAAKRDDALRELAALKARKWWQVWR